MENVNRDPGRAVLHDRRRPGRGARHLGATMMMEGDITAAHSNAERAGRAITHQSEEHAVGAHFRGLDLQPLDRFRLALSRAVKKARVAGGIEDGDLLVVRRGRMINPDLCRADRRPSRRDEPGRTAGTPGERRDDQAKDGKAQSNHAIKRWRNCLTNI